MTRRRTVRFWIWNNGPIRLTLTTERPELRWAEGHSTDEGYHQEQHRWTLETGDLPHDDLVTHEFCSYSQDCDGPLERYGLYACPAALLAAGNECPEDRTPAGDPITYPAWERVSTGQRDLYAEGMGY